MLITFNMVLKQLTCSDCESSFTTCNHSEHGIIIRTSMLNSVGDVGSVGAWVRGWCGLKFGVGGVGGVGL